MSYLSNLLQDILNKWPASKVLADFPLHKLTFFKAGGLADYLFIPSSKESLGYFLSNKPHDVPVTVIGAGSNILIRDKGIRGVVIKLNHFNKITQVSNSLLKVDAMVFDKVIALFAYNQGMSGLEFLYTIPGTIGGAVVMNAGAYGRSLSDIFISSEVFDMHGNLITFDNKNIEFGYRYSKLGQISNDKLIIISVTLRVDQSTNSKEIYDKMIKMEQHRLDNQPHANSKTAGSSFVNPDGEKAWELIKNAFNGGEIIVNGARISDKHYNFIENYNHASAHDIEELILLVQDKVYNKYQIKLQPEIKIIGER